MDGMPEEWWAEVCNIVEEAVIKTIPKKKEWNKAKSLSEEALQIAEKRKDAKVKGEKERYTHENKYPPNYGNIILDSLQAENNLHFN